MQKFQSVGARVERFEKEVKMVGNKNKRAILAILFSIPALMNTLVPSTIFLESEGSLHDLPSTRTYDPLGVKR